MTLISSWSGGKDSCYASMLAVAEGHRLSALLNIMNENGRISRSHGLTKEILEQQAKAIGVPFYGIPASWKEYERNYIKALHKIKRAHHPTGVIFGDIDLISHKDWEEKVCATANLKAHLPLWRQNRKALVHAMIDNGIKAIIVSCDMRLGKKFLGREINKDLVEELESMGIDACGENGEYHTVVTDCPLFSKGIDLTGYTSVVHDDYCFIDWDG